MTQITFMYGTAHTALAVHFGVPNMFYRLHRASGIYVYF